MAWKKREYAAVSQLLTEAKSENGPAAKKSVESDPILS
jgi:hypothetical protein